MHNLFYLLVLLNVADVVLTLKILKRGGREMNPVLVALFGRSPSLLALAAIKVVGLAFIYFVLPFAPLFVMQALVLGYISLIAWNLSQYKRSNSDKALHFAAGVFIAFLFTPLGLVHAFLAALAAGVLKEVYDRLFGGSVELLDVVATAAGGVIVVGLVAAGSVL